MLIKNFEILFCIAQQHNRKIIEFDGTWNILDTSNYIQNIARNKTNLRKRSN